MRLIRPDEADGVLGALEQFYGALCARQFYGDHVCMAVQPGTPHGSPDDIVDKWVPQAAQATAAIGRQIAEAVDGASSVAEIRNALNRVERDIDETDLAEALSEGMVRAAMLGSVDSQWEREHEDEVDLVSFATQFAATPRSLIYGPFESAIDFLLGRKVMTREAFDALEEGTRRRAFTFAGAATQDILATAHAELGRMVGEGAVFEEGGPSFPKFRKFWEERIESAGWTPSNPSHVETIYRTNVASIYSSGRFIEATQPSVIAAVPYWQIRTVKDSRQRPSHRRADGIILPKTHPFWRGCFPPFGYACRCRAISRSKRWVERTGARTDFVPSDLPDPGFDSGTRTLVQVPVDLLAAPAT